MNLFDISQNNTVLKIFEKCSEKFLDLISIRVKIVDMKLY
jgi:hypothetical protein